jgi:RNA polymerase sigma-70 factor, ECF subfamily
MCPKQGEITELLRAARSGDQAAEAGLLSAAYAELRRIATRFMRYERQGHTLQPTALINEAYLRLTENRLPDLRDRAHFFAVAAKIMRRILVDSARKRAAAKRGGPAVHADVDEVKTLVGIPSAEMLALNRALDELEQLNPRQGAVVELRFFGGLTDEEVAAVLGVNPRTVKRDWAVAKAWLYTQLGSSL